MPTRPVSLLACTILLAVAACDSPQPDPPASPPPEPEAAAAGGKPGAEAMAGEEEIREQGSQQTGQPHDAALFSGRVWRVRQSASVAEGTTYAFLEDGTLVVDAPGGTPMHGRWDYRDGALTMTEEGIDYPVTIVEATADRLHLRSHNPGEPVEMVLVPAPDQPLPPAQPADTP